jgi:hypothetical protein
VHAAGAIYHLKYKPPPAEVMDRLVQRSDDTEEKVRGGGASLWGKVGGKGRVGSSVRKPQV